jgi:anaerobic magnesium-protoporphyrin IX monomethyl ester cyclase
MHKLHTVGIKKPGANTTMKILLASPSSVPTFMKAFMSDPVVPIGLCYLAGILEKNGHDVVVRDYTFWTKRQIKKDVNKFSPALIGIPCFTLLRMKSFALARMLKKAMPKSPIVIGGPHATFFPEHVFELTPADFVVSGEGDYTILELAQQLESGKNFGGIKGLIYKDGAGKIVKNMPREQIRNLDELPTPIYDDFDMSRQKDIPVISSRGCPFGCTFCSTNRFWGRNYRYRSAKNVVDEIEALVKKYSKKKILFWDDNFTLNKKRTIEICDEIIKRDLKIEFTADARVDGIDEELLKKLKEAGCRQLNFGIESGSPTILKNISKGYDIELAKERLKLTQKYVGVLPLLMFGNKGESNETVDETIKFIKEAVPNHAPSPYSPVYIFPNCPLYEEVKSKGLIDDSYWKKPGIPVYTAEHSEWQLFLLRERFARAFMSRISVRYFKFLVFNLIRNFFKLMLG